MPLPSLPVFSPSLSLHIITKSIASKKGHPLPSSHPYWTRIEAMHERYRWLGEMCAAQAREVFKVEGQGLIGGVRHLSLKEWEESGRGWAQARDKEGVSLVVTLGGDGTFLNAAQSLHCHSGVKPLWLAINSSPSSSIGSLCGLSLSSPWEEGLLEGEIHRALQRVKEGDYTVVDRTRIQVHGGEEYPLGRKNSCSTQ